MRAAADPCLFVWGHPVHGVIVILVHVDDVLLAAKDRAGIEAVNIVITPPYAIRDLGEVRDFLGTRVTRDRAARTLTLTSPGYTRALVGAHGLGSANPAKTPMALGTILTRTGDDLLEEGGPAYAELVGGLLDLAPTTRPDMTFAAGVLSRYMHAPEATHWRAAKRALRYLAGTMDMGLCFGGGGDLTACCDADFNERPYRPHRVFHPQWAAWSRRRQPGGDGVRRWLAPPPVRGSDRQWRTASVS